MKRWSYPFVIRVARTSTAYSTHATARACMALCKCNTAAVLSDVASGSRPTAHRHSIMYSVTSMASFRVCEFIHDKLLTNLLGGVARCPVVLVGNKSDLDNERYAPRCFPLASSGDVVPHRVCVGTREVAYSDGRQLAQSWGCPFVESSAKHNDNIGEAFHRVLVAIHKQENGDLEEPGFCSCTYCTSWLRLLSALTPVWKMLQPHAVRACVTCKALHNATRIVS